MSRPLVVAMAMFALAAPLAAQDSVATAVTAPLPKRKPGPTLPKATAAARAHAHARSAKADSAKAAATASAALTPDPARAATPAPAAAARVGIAPATRTPAVPAAAAATVTVEPTAAAPGVRPSEPPPSRPLASGPPGVPATPLRLKFWWELDAGYGSLKFSCSLCVPDRSGGLAGEGALGLRLARGFGLGAHVALLRSSRDGDREETWRFGPVVRWAPNPGSGFYLRGALDLLHYRAHPLNDQQNNSGNRTKSNALGLGVGVGYDFPVSRGLSLSPWGEIIAGTKADFIQGSAVQRPVSITVLQAGLAIRSR